MTRRLVHATATALNDWLAARPGPPHAKGGRLNAAVRRKLGRIAARRRGRRRRAVRPAIAAALLAPSLLLPRPGGAAEAGMDAPAWGAGKWSLDTARNDAGAVLGYRLQLLADDWVLGQQQRISQLRLTVNCNASTTDVWIENEMGARGDEVDVTVAFDAERPERRNWGTAENGQYVGLWGLGGPFIERALRHRWLRMTFEMAAGVPAIATFDLHGLDNAIGQLGQSCDWNKGHGDRIDAQR